jgi:uncharacterized protein (DUF2141 family)
MHTRILSPLFSFLAAMLAAAAVHAGDLGVEVKLPAERQGTVRAALFDKADGFPRGTPLRTATAQPVQGKATLQFADLPTGDYALTAYLDENSNSKLDSNLFGLPTEPYGFSRNARGMAGPPPFADATFRVEDGMQQQTFDLK